MVKYLWTREHVRWFMILKLIHMIYQGFVVSSMVHLSGRTDDSGGMVSCGCGCWWWCWWWDNSTGKKGWGGKLSPLMLFKSPWSESHKLTTAKQVAPMGSEYEFHPRELGGMRTSHVCSLNFIKKTFSLFPNYKTIATYKYCW